MLVYQRVVRMDVESAKISEMCRSQKIAVFFCPEANTTPRGANATSHDER